MADRQDRPNHNGGGNPRAPLIPLMATRNNADGDAQQSRQNSPAPVGSQGGEVAAPFLDDHAGHTMRIDTWLSNIVLPFSSPPLLHPGRSAIAPQYHSDRCRNQGAEGSIPHSDDPRLPSCSCTLPSGVSCPCEHLDLRMGIASINALLAEIAAGRKELARIIAARQAGDGVAAGGSIDDGMVTKIPHAPWSPSIMALPIGSAIEAFKLGVKRAEPPAPAAPPAPAPATVLPARATASPFPPRPISALALSGQEPPPSSSNPPATTSRFVPPRPDRMANGDEPPPGSIDPRVIRRLVAIRHTLSEILENRAKNQGCLLAGMINGRHRPSLRQVVARDAARRNGADAEGGKMLGSAALLEGSLPDAEGPYDRLFDRR